MKLSLFAIQIFLPLPAADTARHGLVDVVRGAPDECDFATKNASYGRAVAALLPHTQNFALGVWDYIEEHDRAVAEFKQWCDGTENDAGDAPEVNPYREGSIHMFVTLLFLMAHERAADRVICEACRVPEGTEWQRRTFATLLSILPRLNFATISSDAIYVRPASRGGVTQAELAEEHYAYLNPLT